jgi:hypothetical protein
LKHFLGGRAKIFFNKGINFTGFASLRQQGRAASHPTARLRRAEQAGKNFSLSDSPNFCPSVFDYFVSELPHIC